MFDIGILDMDWIVTALLPKLTVDSKEHNDIFSKSFEWHFLT